MQSTLSLPPLGSSEAEVNPVFNIVIAYEDFETGKHAKKTYDYLVEHLSTECEFTNQMWKFEVLSVAKLRHMAVKDAVDADIILVSAHGQNDLPEEVKAWIEGWLAEPHQAIALVGLFNQDESLDNPARDYLERIARRGNMEFFSQPGFWPGRSRTSGAWDRNDKTFSVLAGVMEQSKDVSHWGINE
jgi:hypothetical protein